MQEGGDENTGRLEWAFREATSRRPVQEETQRLAQLMEKHRSYFQAASKATMELLEVGMTPVPKELEPVELATWTSVARAILNLNEVITRN